MVITSLEVGRTSLIKGSAGTLGCPTCRSPVFDFHTVARLALALGIMRGTAVQRVFIRRLMRLSTMRGAPLGTWEAAAATPLEPQV